MSLIIKCPITGAAFRLPMFTSSHDPQDSSSVNIVCSPHPLLSVNIQQLAALPFPETAQDRHITLCAWLEKLAQIGAVHWCGVLNPANFSARWYIQQFEQFATLAMRLIANSNHPIHNTIPQLNITADLTSENLQSWRESAQEMLASFDTVFAISERMRLTKDQAAAAALMESLDEEYSPESINTRRAKHRRNYVQSSLMFNEQQAQVDTVLKVLAKPHTFELTLLQQVKAFCLDFLPENGHENYNDKQEVIELLDAAILDRVGMAQLLGFSNSADDTQAAEIRAKYTTVIGAQQFTTTTNHKISAVINANTRDALTSDVTSSVPQYSAEPQRADFKHAMIFEAAHRLWRTQNPISATAVSELL